MRLISIADPTSLYSRVFRNSYLLKYISKVIPYITVILFLVLAIEITPRSSLLFFHIAGNYNEGWNAYFADRAVHGGELYPNPGEMITNNYFPVSFYLVGWVGTILGDTVLAGRLVGFLSFLCVLITLYQIVSENAKSRLYGLYSALFASFMFSTFPGERIFLNDPQMLAHAIMIRALYLMWPSPQRRQLPILAALATVLALGVKHNIIAVPLMITVWLALYERRRLAAWILCLAIGGLLGLAWFYGEWGQTGLSALMSPRVISASKLFKDLYKWPIRIAPEIMVFIVLYGLGVRDQNLRKSGFFLACALIEFLLCAPGVGVDGNSLFDAIIACALVVGFGISALRALPAKLILVLFLCGQYIPLAVFDAYRRGFLTDPVAVIATAENQTASAIMDISRASDPTICEDLVICYWAGKWFFFDPFNMTQQYNTKTRNDRPILNLLETRSIKMIELDAFSPGRGDERITQPISHMISQNYKFLRKDGTFLLFVPDGVAPQ
jgi:hypothetical protein